jgi:DNA integrity scanning protein DisA with diadenylate cyclase activity
MDQTESPTSSVSDLSNQVAALQRQVFSLLLALIVVSGTVTVYLYRQASLMRKDIESIRPQATQYIETFNKNRAVMQNFIEQLNAYSQTHPDIHQLLLRNGFAAPAAPAAAPKK